LVVAIVLCCCFLIKAFVVCIVVSGVVFGGSLASIIRSLYGAMIFSSGISSVFGLV